MISRCYDPVHKQRRPGYEGCTVCDEWLLLSTFASWFEKQNWRPRLYLDKDIIQPGNKVYCPEFCCFITVALNNLINWPTRKTSKFPIGVTQGPATKLFSAKCSVNGRTKWLGSFATPEEAHAAYVGFKCEQLLQAAAQQTDQRIAQGLRKHADLLKGNQ